MNLAQHLLLLGLRAYKLAVSPALHFLGGPGAGCRFTPTCSEYATEAVRRHGLLRGAALALRRVGRCHPWGGCGADPVPDQNCGGLTAEGRVSLGFDRAASPLMVPHH